uniref:Aminotransferase class I/classII large domain-containing protein n=2 Tax=Timspurckia oligopyrenoides TaxID=708627 RepID=A0A7S0ZBX1_9RHOD|mmetsp:Transcript_11811/g.21362  ORF Transcript_11811/g.21362 Transcript_11811/m.21362 type:complete len:502 (+) Transcript_11811:1229-2734(+)
MSGEVGAQSNIHSSRIGMGDTVNSAQSADLSRDALNPKVTAMEYAVRGKIVLRAEEHVQALKRGEARPFSEVVMCNIGNPQAVGQPPLTFVRQLIALVTCPWILQQPQLRSAFPVDVVARAEKFLSQCSGTGAYSTSKGVPAVRSQVAEFLKQRDGYDSDIEHIFLTNGASEGVKSILSLLVRHENDGILIPVPQYPLYSASLTLLGGAMIPYYLDEAHGWGLDVDVLAKNIQDARNQGIHPRMLAVINPGNPTGQVLSEENMRAVVSLCEKEGLVLLADEVYQENIYTEMRSFVSFKKVVCDMKSTVPLASVHSTSKGVLGECGARGGYLEVMNVGDDMLEQLYKLASVNLCSNLVGQLVVSVLVDRPRPGDASYELFQKEYSMIMGSLRRKALKLVSALNQFEGVTCNDSEGAMYAFPQITLPSKAIEAAKERGLNGDVFYCMELLDSTGVCVVPGSGFRQQPGTYHLRTTFLPPEEKIDSVIEQMSAFHAEFMKKYSD